MAKQTNYSAKQRLTPLKGDIGRDMQYWDQAGRQNRREDRYDEQLELRKQQIEDEKKSKYNKFIKPLNNFDTGSRTLNQIHADYLMQAEEQIVPLVEKLQNTEEGTREHTKALLKIQEIQKSPEKLKQVTDFYTKANEAYVKAKESGDVFEDLSWENKFQEGFKNIELGIDDNGNPAIAFMDSDGDEENDFEDVVSYNEIQNGVAIPKFMKRYNKDNIANSIAEKYGEETITTDSGGVEHKTIQPNKKAINNRANKILVNPDGSATEMAKSFLREQGNPNFNNPSDEDLQGLEQGFIQDIYGRYDTTDNTDVDYNAIRNARKDREEEKVEPILSEKNYFPVTSSDFGSQSSNIDTTKNQGVRVPEVQKGNSNTQTEPVTLNKTANGNLSKFSIESYTVDRSGNIVAQGSYLKEKAITNLNIPEGGNVDINNLKARNPEAFDNAQIILSDREKNHLAEKMNVTVEELQNHASINQEERSQSEDNSSSNKYGI